MMTPYPAAGDPALATAAQIIDAVCASHEVTRQTLLTSDCRTRNVTAARREAILTLRSVCGWSSIEIGNALQLEHTTVLYHLDSDRKLRELDADLIALIEEGLIEVALDEEGKPRFCPTARKEAVAS
jgi:chromosomal replication initiation ATPase DnaA